MNPVMTVVGVSRPTENIAPFNVMNAGLTLPLGRAIC